MRVVFRVEASARAGSGHVMRCINLARELRRRGVDVRFVSRMHAEHMISRVEQEDIPVHRLPPPGEFSGSSPDDGYAEWRGVSETTDARETVGFFAGEPPDVMIVDHYGLGAEWERAVRPAVGRILAIDDLARRHECDLLLDQNWFGEQTAARSRYAGRIPAGARMLLGPRFALLGPEYASLRVAARPRDGTMERVLVFFGAGDATNQTAMAVTALSTPRLAHLTVDVILGVHHPDAPGIQALVAKRERTHLHRNLPSLAPLLARADLALGAGGGTTWERACLGVPSIVVVLADNQAESSRVLAREGRQRVLDDRSGALGADDWRRAIEALLHARSEVMALSVAISELTDGLGACRIARALGAGSERITMRSAEIRDEQLLLDWANDPEVREASFSRSRITREGHARWFREKLTSDSALMLIGEDDAGVPVGLVRFELKPTEGGAVVSISVDARARGAGIGDTLLREAVDTWRARSPAVPVVAEVRVENERSTRLFLRCGFAEQPSGRMEARRFVFHPTRSPT